MTTPRFLASVGTPIAVVAFLVGLQHPALFLWFGGVALVLGGLGGYAATYVFRGERDEAELKVERLEAECNAHAAENARLRAEGRPRRLTVKQARALEQSAPIQRPDLSIVPPIADGHFPVHTAVDDDELTAIMRAVEGEVSP